MEKVKRFFLELNEKRKYQLAVFVVSMCIVLGLYAGVGKIIQTSKSHQYTVIEDNNLIRYIEGISITKGKLKINGWSFYKNVGSNRVKCQLFLRNVEGEEVVWLDTKQVEREEVNQYFDCEYDYRLAGFEASTKLKALNIDENNYEIFIKLTYTKSSNAIMEENVVDTVYEKTVSTKRYISGGMLTASYPKTTQDIDCESEVMKEILKNGCQLAYNEDGDMYIFQYQDKLYWIAGEKAYFEDDGSTLIQVSYETTRPDKLPSVRIENNWDWDNVSFVFEQNEIKDKTIYPYRIEVQEIPKQYPVTYLGTGYYRGSQLIWEEYQNLDIIELLD